MTWMKNTVSVSINDSHHWFQNIFGGVGRERVFHSSSSKGFGSGSRKILDGNFDTPYGCFHK